MRRAEKPALLFGLSVNPGQFGPYEEVVFPWK